MDLCSDSVDNNEDEDDVCENNLQDFDLNELRNTDGIHVWSTNQETLEKQALKELEIFTEEIDSKTTSSSNLEEGEIKENSKDEKVSFTSNVTLDINSYIKRQEELKKRQEYKRSLQVTEYSRNVAEKISKHQHNKLKSKQKRTHSKNDHKNIIKKQKIDDENDKKHCSSGSEYVPTDDELSADSDYEPSTNTHTLNRNIVKSLVKVIDDGSVECYKKRLQKYYETLESEECNASTEEFHIISGDLKIPIKIWESLYRYQQQGVKWLWQLHQKYCGGLLGDEMGLGKTVQIIAFLFALNYSHIISGGFTGLGSSLIVCPATVLHQWVKHFHEWTPELRVAVLHQSGSYTGNKTDLIKDINKTKGILITTYTGVLKFKNSLAAYNWHYVILDEGHKIRNPDAKISISVKELHTPHRIILTGSPMQNNLQELWSLFDFINPGMLGNLSIFLEHFASPIMQGGYVNATPIQEATALSVATTLKEIIEPYLLRRAKSDVQQYISLPNKSEQVLFCSLTPEQRDLYKGYLMGEHVGAIIGKSGKNWCSENHMKANMFVAITTLRKICNHPDLYLNEFDDDTSVNYKTEEKNDYYKRSGKMIVVSALLKIWKRQGHRVLLFTQGRAMLAVFEIFLQQQGYKYIKMDGSTSVTSRQPLIEKFNKDDSYEVFLLTTRVGGVGVNLTGANRVIIYDPDWNPATDTQARERAWRIGQNKQVTIYRLLTAGTIEEKMYQRQVWKQLLSNKVLLDPKTQKFFKTSDLHDLFSLQEESVNDTETANIFKKSRVNIQQKLNKKKKHKSKHSKLNSEPILFTEDKIQAMKNLAQQISKSISQNKTSEPIVEKSIDQKILEEDRQEKLKEKEFLKKLTPLQLRELNRRKTEKYNVADGNKIDDFETTISFDKALEVCGETSILYHKMKGFSETSSKTSSECSSEAAALKQNVLNSNDEKSSRHKKKHKMKNIIIDKTGKIDGEVIEGLLKTEITKKKKVKDKKLNQDEFILEKLFSKKGVHTALQHEVIVQSQSESHNHLRINYEAKAKADLALQAIRKSRLNSWRW